MKKTSKSFRGAKKMPVLKKDGGVFCGSVKKLANKMAVPHMADLRNVYSVKDAKRAGFEAYDSIGRMGFVND